jgi:hypothetical protein
MAAALDSSGQLTLVACARASLAARADLTFFSYITAQQVNQFVIDFDVLIGTKLADLWAGNISPSSRLLGFHHHIIGHAILSD